MMKSVWALFFTKATERLFSNMDANKDLPEPRLNMTPNIDLPNVNHLSCELRVQLSGTWYDIITQGLHDGSA